MDPIVDLLQQLEPEAEPPPPDVEGRQRDALRRAMAEAEGRRANQGRRRPRPRRWVIVSGGAAVAVAVAAALLLASSSPPAPRSAVLTAITRALAGTGQDIEEVRSSVSAPVAAVPATTSWVDLATGACRTDISISSRPTVTLFVEHGRLFYVDRRARHWWSAGTRGVTCDPLTPRAIEQDVASGDYTVVGHPIVDGRRALKLTASTTTTGPHPVPQTSTLWVDASTHLPIRSTSVGRHLGERTSFTWLPATSENLAMLKVAIPAGFRRVAAPAPQVRVPLVP